MFESPHASAIIDNARVRMIFDRWGCTGFDGDAAGRLQAELRPPPKNGRWPRSANTFAYATASLN
jgi:hypothetical protein